MNKLLQHLLIPTLCTVPVFSQAQDSAALISDASKLSINGKSNVTDFQCRSEHDLEQDSLHFDYRYNGSSIDVEGVLLALEVDRFDCGKRGINRDFKSTLKYKEHPFIEIRLHELILSDSTDLAPKYANVTITIADEERPYLVPLNSFASYNNKVLVSGNKFLKMTDFGLTPPTPLFGLIRVQDELNIEFEMVIKLDLDQ